jgi:photosystem II stability/assembly factor-like uncharacterized protein
VNWKAATPIRSAVNQPFIWSYANIKAGFATDHVQLFTTTDSGQTWKTIKPDVDFKDVTQIDFISNTIGWAIGKNIFIKTIDGGFTWKNALE